MKDPIVSEIHDIREQLLRDHQGDPVLYARSAMKRQQERSARFITTTGSRLASASVNEPQSNYSPESQSLPSGKKI